MQLKFVGFDIYLLLISKANIYYIYTKNFTSRLNKMKIINSFLDKNGCFVLILIFSIIR